MYISIMQLMSLAWRIFCQFACYLCVHGFGKADHVGTLIYFKNTIITAYLNELDGSYIRFILETHNAKSTSKHSCVLL